MFLPLNVGVTNCPNKTNPMTYPNGPNADPLRTLVDDELGDGMLPFVYFGDYNNLNQPAMIILFLFLLIILLYIGDSNNINQPVFH